ncbi:unnamed protein product [Chrysoparadoxa australica]
MGFLLSLITGLCKNGCTVVGLMYPALASAKVAVQRDDSGLEQWLTYWIVASLLAVIEVLMDFVAYWGWLPLYYELKLAFLIWLTLPRYQGASWLYNTYLVHHLIKYEDHIDGGLEEVQLRAGRHLRSITSGLASEALKAVTTAGASGGGAAVISQIMQTYVASDPSAPDGTPTLAPAMMARAGSNESTGVPEEVLVDTLLLLEKGLYVPVRREGERSPSQHLVRLLDENLLLLLPPQTSINSASTGGEHFTIRQAFGADMGVVALTDRGLLELHVGLEGQGTLLAALNQGIRKG